MLDERKISCNRRWSGPHVCEATDGKAYALAPIQSADNTGERVCAACLLSYGGEAYKEADSFFAIEVKMVDLMGRGGTSNPFSQTV